MPATTTTAAKAARAPKDPEGAALAAAALKLARTAGLKSAYTPAEGRGVIDHMAIERKRGMLAISKDGGEPVRVKVATLRALLAGEKDDDTRATAKVMAEFSRGMPGTVHGKSWRRSWSPAARDRRPDRQNQAARRCKNTPGRRPTEERAQ